MMTHKFRNQAIEYFKNCSDMELFDATFALIENDIPVINWSCEKCKEKYGNCDNTEESGNPLGCCFDRFCVEDSK